MLAATEFTFYLYIFTSVILLFINFLSFRYLTKIKPVKNNLLILIAIAYLVRLIFIFTFPFASGYDIKAFIWAGQEVLAGRDIYWGLKVREVFAFLPALRSEEHTSELQSQFHLVC